MSDSNELPKEIEFPEQGIAKRLQPRGMSDYGRGHGNAEYRTSSGACIMYRSRSTKSEWQARYKSVSSKWKPTLQEAIESYNIKKENENGSN